ncbi:MAG TPA: plasmid pRiA4b ORF-3 family protein [Arachidicoccus sp.]
MVFQFKITLEESMPAIWRRILIPDTYTFYRFHLAIQGAFGWENAHLFQFCEQDITDNISYQVPYEEEELEGSITRDARKKRITEVFGNIGDKYTYIYDFGDSWMHQLLLEKINDDDISRPHCIGGKSACPPEDCGGIKGYYEMLHILKMPKHPEYKHYGEWLGLVAGEEWDASACNIEEINKRFALLDNSALEI